MGKALDRIGDFSVKKILPLFKVNPKHYDYIISFRRTMKPSETTLPIEFLDMGARMLFRGILNAFVIQICLDWIWPYAMEKEFDPTSTSFMPRAHMLYLVNSCHRNWTGLGNLESKNKAIVDVRGLVTPWFDGWSLDFLTEIEGKINAPSKMENVKQNLKENIPIVETSYESGGIEVKSEVLATEFEGNEFILEEVNLKNEGAETKKISLFFSVRPANPEGVTLIKNLAYKQGFFLINKKIGLILKEKPEKINMGNYEKGDAFSSLNSLSNIEEINCNIGMANGYARYNCELPSGEKKKYMVVMTKEAIKEDKIDVEKIKRIEFDREEEKVISQWKSRLEKTMVIKIPHQKLQDSFEANKSYLLLACEGDENTTGPYTYHHFWFRDAAYILTAMDKIGLHKEAERILLHFPEKQKRDGYFLSQKGEWDSNGQAIWALVEHYRYTNNLEYLKQVYPSIKKGVAWIENKRKKTMKNRDDPHYGLLPPGLSAEHLGPHDYFYWDDFWALGGIKAAIEVAERLGFNEDKKHFENAFHSFQEDVLKSLKAVEKRLAKPLIPASPYRRVDAGAIGSIAGWYPLRIFSLNDEGMINTIDELLKTSSVDDIFFHQITHSGYNSYLNMQIAQCHLLKRNPKAWKVTEWLLENATPTFTWPEAIHPITRGGVIGDGHHFWATADWIHLLRNLLFFEEGDVLVLTPLLPEDWIRENQEISAVRCPSYFGEVGFRLQFSNNSAILNLNCDFRSLPRLIEFNLPFAIEEARVDGEIFEALEKRVVFPPQAKEVKIKYKISDKI